MVGLPNSPDPEPVHRMQLLSKFIEIYFPDTTQGCSNHDQSPASWAHILPEITVSNSACNTSLAALCTAQLGLWNYDALLGKKGSQIYGSSLGELRKAIRSIGCRKLVTPEATIASIVILSTYDQFSGPSGQNTVCIHVRGASRILQLLGASFCETQVGSILFSKIRTISIFEALRTRQSSLLAGLELQHSRKELENYDLYVHLQDLMIQLPFIMESFDTLIRSITRIPERPVLIQLGQLCSRLSAKLHTWNEKLKEQVPGQLYWMTPSVAHSPAYHPILGSVFPLALQFPNLRIAQLLLLYWSILIMLYRTVQDIENRIGRQIANDTKTHHSFDPYAGYKIEPYYGQRPPSNEIIALLANNISQSLEYCYRTTNGTHGPQLASFPLWVAYSFYKSQPERNMELA